MDPATVTLERVLSRIRIEPLTGCWLYTMKLNHNGYARIKFNNTRYMGHRFVYEAVKGPIPPDMEIDHLCRQRACLNPAHLEAVSHRENTLRSTAVSANNARKTHCLKGHPLTDEKIGRQRVCKVCARSSADRYRHRLRTARATA